MKGKGIQQQFIQKVGEPGYTVNMFRDMLEQLGLYSPAYTTVMEYCRREGLILSLEELEIEHEGVLTEYLIPQRNLEKILERFDIPATVKDLQRAADELEYEWFR
jgi:hypothetical protein